MKVESIIKAATVVTILAVVSKVLGIAKVALIAYYFGRTFQADAFLLAFSLLEFLRHFIAGGTLVSAIIPIYRSLVVSGETRKLARAASNLINIFSLILIVVVVCWYLFGSTLFSGVIDIWEVHSKQESFPRATWDLTVHICNVMFPAIVFFGIVSVATAILNSFQHFAAPAATAGLLNVFIIGCLLLFHSSLGIYSLAVGFVLGTFSQILLLYGPMKSRLKRYYAYLSFKDDYIRDVWRLLKPLLWGLIAYRLILILNKFFASTTGQGNVASVQYSELVITGFVDVIGISLAIALYPALSELFTLKKESEFRETTNTFLRITVFLALPVMGFLMVFAYPVIELFFQHRAFTEADTLATFRVLIYFAPTVLFQSFIYVIRNVFYARQNMATPVFVAISALVLNLVLVYILIEPLGVRGIVLASSIAYALQAFSMFIILIRRDKKYPLVSFMSFLFNLIIITSISLIGSRLFYNQLSHMGGFSNTFIGHGLVFLGSSSIFLFLFCLIGSITRIKELQQTWLFFKTKLMQTKSP